MKFLLLVVLLLLGLAWPVGVVAVLVLVVSAVLALLGERRAAGRAGWTLAAAAACTAVTAYAYGLRTTTAGAWTDPDDRCALASPGTYAYGHRGPAGGSQSMWPLHDTTCGADLVPGFVNPLVTGAVLLFAVLVVYMTATRIRSRHRLRTG
ncbi:hypothetical protein [Sphaerisporangium corydalis]|uniref:Integral membrane protein n=1 Tax=Sphaerisporangium corydalis TaxID=1441875 RepID=A0ABV9E8U9_9ACTN|nr:hypothetical protein [Sphaerisporangium corydalis]